MRRICLDTETTGLRPDEGDRIVEIGCVEIDEDETGKPRFFHVYLNPERDVPRDAMLVHGLDNAFLSDKPRFADVVDDLLKFVTGAELIIHNASFDTAFLDMELQRAGKGVLSDYCPRITDSLAVARSKFPGRRNSLDVLCDRFGIDRSKRDVHGALLDADLLAQVYVALEWVQPVPAPLQDRAGIEKSTESSVLTPEEEAQLQQDFQDLCDARIEIVLPMGFRRPWLDFSHEFTGVAQQAYVCATTVLNSEIYVEELEQLFESGKLDATTMSSMASVGEAHSLLSRIIEALVTVEISYEYYDHHYSLSHMRHILELFLKHGFSCKEREGLVGAQALSALLRFRMPYFAVEFVIELLDAGADSNIRVFHPEYTAWLTAEDYVEMRLRDNRLEDDAFYPEFWYVISRIFKAFSRGLRYSRINFFHADGLFKDLKVLGVTLITDEPEQSIRLKKGPYHEYRIEPFHGVLRFRFSRKRNVYLLDRGFAVVDPTLKEDIGGVEVDAASFFKDFVSHGIRRTFRYIDRQGYRSIAIEFGDGRELVLRDNCSQPIGGHGASR